MWSFFVVVLLGLCWDVLGQCNVERFDKPEDFTFTSPVTSSGASIYFNPNFAYGSSGYKEAILNTPANLTQPWRIEFQISAQSCEKGYPLGGFPGTFSMDDFQFAILKDLNQYKATQFYNCQPYILLLFHFQHSLPFVELIDTCAPATARISPTGYAWPPDISNCESVFNVLVDFNKTHLAIFINSNKAWFTYPMRDAFLAEGDDVYFIWQTLNDKSSANMVLTNLILYRNCLLEFGALETVQCSAVHNSYIPSLYQFNVNSLPINESAIDLKQYSSVFPFKLSDVSLGWHVSFTVTPMCRPSACKNPLFSFMIEYDYYGSEFIITDGVKNALLVDFTSNDGCASSISLFLKTRSPISNTVSSVDLPPMGCSSTLDTWIGYNGTHLKVFVNSVKWMDYALKIPEIMLLADERLAYMGWVSERDVQLTNIRLSQQHMECVPTSLLENIICSNLRCILIQNSTISISDGDYFLPGTTVNNLTIHIITNNVGGNISVTNSTIYFTTNTTFGGPIVIQNSVLYLSQHVVSVSGCLSLQNNTLVLPSNPQNRAIFDASCLQTSNNFVQFQSNVDCTNVSTYSVTEQSIQLLINTEGCNSPSLPIPTIVGVTLAVIFILGVSIFVIKYYLRQKALSAVDVLAEE